MKRFASLALAGSLFSGGLFGAPVEARADHEKPSSRPTVTTQASGRYEVRTEQVHVPGRYEERTRAVAVPGRWEVTYEEVCVPGHYEEVNRRVQVPGRWVVEACACRDVKLDFGRVSVRLGHVCQPNRRWIPPSYEDRRERVWVPERRETKPVRKWIPATTCQETYREWVPAHYETRTVQVWVPAAEPMRRYPSRRPRPSQRPVVVVTPECEPTPPVTAPVCEPEPEVRVVVPNHRRGGARFGPWGVRWGRN